jgi:hypothetical protein
MNKKEFYGDEFFAYCCKQYEAARVHLKNCGKPKNEHDKYLIGEAKWSSVFYKRMISDLTQS